MSQRTRPGRHLLHVLRRRIGEKRLARYRRRTVALGTRLATRTVRLWRRLGRRPALRLERAVRLDDTSGVRVVHGTLDPDGHGFRTLEAIARDGTVRDLAAALHRWPAAPRPLGASSRCERFAVRLDAGDETGLRLVDRGGRSCTRRLPTASVGDPFERIRALLEPLHRVAGKRALHERVLGPAIERVMASRTPDRSASASAWNAELASATPGTTLIIPIHGRDDFIEHQLARFANDAELLEQDILYVIDDPRLHARVHASAERLARLYRVPFRTLYLARNLGYAGANNVGADHARGRYLLLLNSDVMPIDPGWLGRLHASAGERLDDALVGARLLYEDGTVQHDGMRFFRSPFHEGLWLNLHPGKGLPEALFDTGSAALPREAVTGACLLIARHRWEQLGGLDERYVIGDFEDSDLCLKARAAGMEVLLCPSARLFHLERQSQALEGAGGWREELTWYNGWRHAGRWHDTLSTIETGRVPAGTRART